MRKNISVTNEYVLELFDKQDNVSKYIERAVLAYEDYKEHDYITRSEVMDLIAKYVPKDNTLKKDVSKSEILEMLSL